MAAFPPPEISSDEELYAWNAIVRGWDQFSGSDASEWPARHQRFAAGLRQQLVVDQQGEAFRKAASIVIQKLESANA